jgi:hypothetical protein
LKPGATASQHSSKVSLAAAMVAVVAAEVGWSTKALGARGRGRSWLACWQDSDGCREEGLWERAGAMPLPMRKRSVWGDHASRSRVSLCVCVCESVCVCVCESVRVRFPLPSLPPACGRGDSIVAHLLHRRTATRRRGLTTRVAHRTTRARAPEGFQGGERGESNRAKARDKGRGAGAGKRALKAGAGVEALHDGSAERERESERDNEQENGMQGLLQGSLIQNAYRGGVSIFPEFILFCTRGEKETGQQRPGAFYPPARFFFFSFGPDRLSPWPTSKAPPPRFCCCRRPAAGGGRAVWLSPRSYGAVVFPSLVFPSLVFFSLT